MQHDCIGISIMMECMGCTELMVIMHMSQVGVLHSQVFS